MKRHPFLDWKRSQPTPLTLLSMSCSPKNAGMSVLFCAFDYLLSPDGREQWSAQTERKINLHLGCTSMRYISPFGAVIPYFIQSFFFFSPSCIFSPSLLHAIDQIIMRKWIYSDRWRIMCNKLYGAVCPAIWGILR